MRKLLNKIALVCLLSLAVTPAALGEGSSISKKVSWLDLFAMPKQASNSSEANATGQLEPELTSKRVNPSSQGRVSLDIRLSQIPESKIFVPITNEDALIEYPAIDLEPFNALDLNIPSSVQLHSAVITLQNSIVGNQVRFAAVLENPARSRIVTASRIPDASIPSINATLDESFVGSQLASTAPLQDSYTDIASRHLPAISSMHHVDSQDPAKTIQNIGTYSGDSNPSMRIRAQLELSEPGEGNNKEAIDQESTDSVKDVATGFSLEFSKQLLGLFIDGEEHPALIAAHDGKEYLLPLVTILASAGASLDVDAGKENSSEIKINTPGGPAVLLESDLRLVDGQLMITQSSLAEKLLIETRFDQSSFALYLALPWSLSQQNDYLAFAVPEADFAPPAASIRNMRADIFYVSNNAGNAMSGDYFFSGNLAGGGWRLRAEKQGDNETTPSEYFWAKDWGKSMILAGNSNYSLHPLLPTVEQTGVQYLYSTTALPASSGADITSTNGTKRIANGIRDIAGRATPGAVAELRIDGRVETRTRVRLDGSYDFPDVELPTRGYSEIIVHLLDNSTGALIETQDFSRRSGIELLAGGQQTVFTALGQQGNALDSQRDSLGAATALQWRYGLSEDLTIELGRQQVGNQIGNEAAISMALSNHWFGSLAFADGMKRSSLGLDIEGGSDKWNLDLSLREFSLKELNVLPSTNDQDYTLGLVGSANPEQADNSKQWARSVNFRYQVNDNFTLGLVGRDTNTSYEQNNFVLPTASWSNRKNLSITARPNSEGEYRIDSRYSPNANGSLRYAYEDNSHLIDYRHRSGSGREYYASYSADDESSGRFETGFVSRFDNERLGTLQMGLVNGESGVGYSLEWEATFVPGVSSQLRLSKGSRNITLSDVESDLFLQWHVTFDFAVAQKRIVPADSSSAATQSAALTGNLMLGDAKIPAKYDIERIDLLIDGDSHTARVQGGRYYVEGLQPGMHKVGIDARYLPMELSPLENQSFWVRLEKSAATEVPLGLEVKYSIAGRVRDSDGINLAYQRLLIIDSNQQLVGEVYTDQFGLYRSNNLAPGSYKILADRNGDGDAEIEVVVSDSYLFEQNLVIPAPNAATVNEG